ncbi:glycoside hydrolase family 88 protein [uncultured Maribacter sp.]|uniref:glycoside hydrolase family 88 protein n=1 Tax=uncultured Maribacter sp. TaxID=431308 RepID=UPI0030EBD3F6|tara:strand:- start:968 stop:2476 length:1509 start_codon:yes stop_codon:yes gene_type:complete
MKRRKFLETVPTAGLGVCLLSSTACNLFLKEGINRTKQINLKIVSSNLIEIPQGKRVAFGWSAAGIKPNDFIILKPEINLPEINLPEANLFLRISTAQETWDNKLVHVKIAGKNVSLGTIDIRSSAVLVPYELEIDKKHVQSINKYGLELFLEASEPLWIFDKQSINSDNRSLLPHLLASSEKYGSIEAFKERFMSVNSIQSFGWREGTVLDGLWQLYSQKGEQRALEVIKEHFDLFFDENKNLIYENAHSIQKDNQIDGIESTIPFATLARLDPTHPILKTVVMAWDSYSKKNGMITGGMTLTAEGCYTVAYPMAVIGRLWKRKDLMQNALAQLRHRFVLVEDGNFYLRYNEGEKTFRNWARGAAWFLLGFVRTISELKEEIQDEKIIKKFKEGVDVVITMQQENGLWNCFMDQDVAPDTSGSAGISAAIMAAVKNGILDQSYRVAAEKCWKSLYDYITPDGFLKGVAQDNRGGVELQQSDYRVIAQMGMGMMAQLYAYRE